MNRAGMREGTDRGIRARMGSTDSHICQHLTSLGISSLPTRKIVTLLAFSLDAKPCMPTVILFYCTFQGSIL